MKIDCNYYRMIRNKYTNEEIKVPCGKCYACKVRNARDWMTRCLFEARYWSEICFATLTYDNDHLPAERSLCKRDLQLFFKRLRKRLENKPIAYLACGEYGSQRGRPHYHALIFGWCPHDGILVETSTHGGYSQYVSPLLSQLWPLGLSRFSICGSDSGQVAGYVARYAAKKRSSKPLEDGQIKEFIVSSRRIEFPDGSHGAIGKRFLIDNTTTAARGFLNDPRSPDLKLPLPRYYHKFLLVHPDYVGQLERRKELRELRVLNDNWLGEDKRKRNLLQVVKYGNKIDDFANEQLPRELDV